jgi:hypothetical protein
MNEARDIALTALDAFKCDLAERFIFLCNGNDFNKLTLEKIYDTINEIYDKHIEKWLDVGTVDSAPTQKWISVKERLPERNCEVLAYYGFEREGSDDLGYMSMGVLAYYAYDRIPHFQHESSGARVTHWMPLPEPPKEEGENT